MTNVLRTAGMLAEDEAEITLAHLPDDFWLDCDDAPAAPTATPAASAGTREGTTLQSHQAAVIDAVLARHGGNVSAAARGSVSPAIPCTGTCAGIDAGGRPAPAASTFGYAWRVAAEPPPASASAMTDPEHLPLVRIEPLGATFDAPDSLTLLEAAAFAHVSLPRSCRNGTCRSCLCRIVSGSVRYTIEWPGLSREEKADGYTLPCVAVATSDLVLDVPDAVMLD